MKNKMTALMALIIAMAMLVTAMTGFAFAESEGAAEEGAADFTLWNEDAPALKALVECGIVTQENIDSWSDN